MVSLTRESLPSAHEVLAAEPPPRPADDGLRASIRALRADGLDGGRLLLGVLDDPTGSQAVHDVQVVTVTDPDAYEAAFEGAAGTCFVLTNTRSLEEADAVALNDGGRGGAERPGRPGTAGGRGPAGGAGPGAVRQPERFDPARARDGRGRGAARGAAVFESSFRALSADELDQLGELLDAALGPDPTAW